MSKLTDKVSYLKGLAAGMKLNMEKDSNKLILEILNAMGEMAEEMQAMTDAHDELNEYVESIDDDLADLEETLFGDDEELEDGCHCGCEDGDCDCEDEDCDCETEVYIMKVVVNGDMEEFLPADEDKMDELSAIVEQMFESWDDDCGFDDHDCGCGCDHCHE